MSKKVVKKVIFCVLLCLLFWHKVENYSCYVKQIRGNKDIWHGCMCGEIMRILHKAELVCGDSSNEWTEPLQDSSVSGNDMNTIDLGSVVGVLLYKKSDKRSTVSSGKWCFCSQLHMLKKGNAPLVQRWHSFHCRLFFLRGSFNVSPKCPCATIRQLKQVEHMGAPD